MTPGGAPVPALVTLRRLRWRARRREFIAGLKRPKRVLGMLLVLGLIGLVIAGQVLGQDDDGLFTGETGRIQFALLLSFFPLMSIFAAAKNGVVAFLPEEVHFLFPAPLTSRQLLTWHVRNNLVKAATGALFFGLFLRPWDAPMLQVMLAWIALFTTTVLLQTRLDLAMIGLPRETRARRARVIGATLVAWVPSVAGLTLLVDGGEPGWHTLRHVGLPAHPFVELLGDDPLTVIAWLLVVVAFAGWLWRGVQRFDGDIREASADISRKTAEMIDRLKAGKMFHDKPQQDTGGRTLPRLPRWGGAGPHCWRQLNALRRTKRSYVALLFVSGIMGFSAGRHSGPEVIALVMAVGIGTIGPLYVQCDFRSDFDNLAWMRSMPARPTAVALGQVLAPTLVLGALQLVVGGWGLFLLDPDQLPLGLAFAALLPLVVMVELIVWNGAFLLFPIRMLQHGGPPNLGKIARIYLTLFAVFAAIGVTLGIAGGLAFGAGWAVQEAGAGRGLTVLAGTVVGFGALAGQILWGLSVLGALYARLDPDRELL